jgi:hypothetical protein
LVDIKLKRFDLCKNINVSDDECSFAKHRGFKKLAVKQRLSRVLFLSAFSISVGGAVLFAQVMPKDWIAQGGKD